MFAKNRFLDAVRSIILFLNGATSASFIIYFRSFQTNIITILTKNICEQISIQYTVPEFEATTFRTWVSSYNHYTRAPAQDLLFFIGIPYHSALIALMGHNVKASDWQCSQKSH